MKQLAGTARNAITFHHKESNEAGVELILLLCEPEYFLLKKEMKRFTKSETVRFNLSLAAAKMLKSDLDEIIEEIESRTPSV
jgi:hypothetical protein